MAYNFEERNFTCIGKTDKHFYDEFFTIGCESVAYKDAVYFVAVDKRADIRLKVGKLYQTSQEEEEGEEGVIFDKIIDHIIQIASSFATPTQFVSELDLRSDILFIKDDTLCVYIPNKESLFSLDLQNEQAELQQHRSPGLSDTLYFHKYCFNNSYLYIIGGGFIYEIDCTDITNMRTMSKESLKGYEDYVFSLKQRAGFLNGKIFYFDAGYFYQVDIETKTMKTFSLDDVIPFDDYCIKRFYITSENEIRVFGFFGQYPDNNQFFMEITFDDNNLRKPY